MKEKNVFERNPGHQSPSVPTDWEKNGCWKKGIYNEQIQMVDGYFTVFRGLSFKETYRGQVGSSFPNLPTILTPADGSETPFPTTWDGTKTL